MLIKRLSFIVPKRKVEPELSSEELEEMFGSFWCEGCKKEMDEETIFIEEVGKFLCKRCRKKVKTLLTDEDL